MNSAEDGYRAQREADDGRLPGWRTRRVRRPAFDNFAFFGAMAGITVLLQSLTKLLTNNINGRTARLLDERELALRGRYGYVGFLVAVWSMVIAAVVLGVTPIKALPYGPFALLISLVALVGNVPSALLAWQLPDDEPDPIAEGEHRG
jgi:hypothetical protein